MNTLVLPQAIKRRVPVHSYHRTVTLIFSLQLLAVVVVVLMGTYNVAPLPAVLLLIVIVCTLGWLAARWQWRPIQLLSNVLNSWSDDKPDITAFAEDRLPRRCDPDLAVVARGLHGFASRLSDYNRRELDFTRDASHELRSPLTVIKMSADMLADEPGLSDFGLRSVQRISRGAHEMESLIEALLLLARDSTHAASDEDFVINDVLQQELAFARQVIKGRPVEIELEEAARFSLHGSPRVFAALSWQLVRNACQQLEQGVIRVTVLPGQISVSNQVTRENTSPDADRHGFELAIARRISERFGWPLELKRRDNGDQVASLRFPEWIPHD